MPSPKTIRKPLAVIAIPGSDEDGHQQADGLAAVCDDGSFFMYSFREGTWTEYPGIPGTPGAEEHGAREEERAAREAAEQARMEAELHAGLDAWMAKHPNARRAKRTATGPRSEG
jgi:hypothetical protein